MGTLVNRAHMWPPSSLYSGKDAPIADVMLTHSVHRIPGTDVGS